MRLWIRRGLIGMGLLAAVWTGQRALAALPPPPEPAGSASGEWLVRARAEARRVAALKVAVSRAEAAAVTLARADAATRAALQRERQTLQQLEAVLAADQTRLGETQAAPARQAAPAPPPAVHTTTGASGGGDDRSAADGGGGDD
ncbi:MAG: hypothetical protein K6V97_00265 [Actinomycetia bacterium]|nr:hypothetical protein [Actinomycetes bacterium]